MRTPALVVDDDPLVRKLLTTYLTDWDFECMEAEDGAAAWELLTRRPFSLVLTDLRMPRLDGMELLRRLVGETALPHAGDPEVAVIVVSGAADIDTAVEALRRGACDLLTKPLDLRLLPVSVTRALERRRLRIDRREYQQALEAMVDARTSELLTTYQETLAALGSALDTRDPETHDHALRVVEYAGEIARAMGLHGAPLRDLQWGAALHDVGKIGVPDGILLKPGPLTDEEWRVMRRHPQIGHQMLQSIPFLHGALPVVLHHHERWDGTGYPDGLAGEAIPLAARIFKAADVFDALTSARPYKQPLAPQDALAELSRTAGTELDPDVVAAVVRVFPVLSARAARRAHGGAPEPGPRAA